jgi:GAF domain-containing protein
MRPTVSQPTASDPDQAAQDAARTLLGSVVRVARAIFGADAASVSLLDERAGELVVTAVAGRDIPIGTRTPAHHGIAGWVVGSGQAMIADDLTGDHILIGAPALPDGPAPRALMAAPLVSELRVHGVLTVIDPSRPSRSDLGELDLLSLFADQAAIALRFVEQCPRCQAHVDLAATDRERDTREFAADLVDTFREFLRGRVD